MSVPPEAAQLIQRAIAAVQRQAWDEAQALANTALQRFGAEANILMVLGSCQAQRGDLPAAIQLYERARALMPTHLHVLVSLAAAYRSSGRLPEARATLSAALQINPGFAIAHNNLGNILLEQGERAAAERCYQRAAASDARYADPLANLARLAEEEHRLEDARALAERALQLAPGSPLALLTRARVRLRQEDAAGASTLLQQLLGGTSLSPTNRIVAQGYLGEAYDKLGRYPEAFAAFSAANALQHTEYAHQYARDRGPFSPPGIARLTSFVEASDPRGWQAPPAAVNPVFLVGFPRSGTTLLDQMLASHPEVTTLEERDTLTDALTELVENPHGLEHWALLGTPEIERLRTCYWERVRAGLSGAPLQRVFVDKQPLNAVLLPLIHRLFPQARIILALRDPRDVVLSCYQQRFGMNAAMYQLLRLDTATAYYAAVMQLVELSRARLPLRVHTLRYEELVTQFETTLRALLGYLELQWHEGVRDYAATARRRSVGTPSAAQVVRPLYGSARGKWRHYQSFLQPYLLQLAPWVRTYGYEA
ncbi:MAG TPA: sulfotransferase [Steroidobacteraceae bacterium]|nr:sulfotransferase [Steroidobacteraceae bacterium]